MHIHILGICGTFMGGLAILARQAGHKVTGSDANVYPPMSTQLEAQGIELMQGYDPEHLQPAPDLVVVGNAMSRGNPAVESMLDRGLPYTSGPQWLREHVLEDRWVLACSGTHGKTTTSSMLAWILEDCGYQPGFLIGGVPADFGVSARVTDSNFFVIEADEYDSAFFDKRSKFVHYKPRTLVINNMEFDHADIFDELSDIQRQFHHVVRTVPAQGRIIYPMNVPAIDETLAMGCWSECETTSLTEAGANWRAEAVTADGSAFEVYENGNHAGRVSWEHCGDHNMNNALAAIAAARHVGVKPDVAVASLCEFKGVKRRMELLAEVNGICVFDDFAHHPTAIELTLSGLRHRVGDGRIFALIEPRSNTMRMGRHQESLVASVAKADKVFWYEPPGMEWSLQQVADQTAPPSKVLSETDAMIACVLEELQEGDQVVIMSNGGFDGIHTRMVDAVREKFSA